MTRDEAKAELERIATEAPYERDRIQAIRLLREMWEEDVDPQTRMAELFARAGAMSELLPAAFGALGPAPSRRELGLVAHAVRDCRDREVLGLWDGPDYRPGWERLVEIAEEADAGYYVALDLYAEVSNPGSVSQYGGRRSFGGGWRDAEGAARGLGPFVSLRPRRLQPVGWGVDGQVGGAGTV